MATPSNTQDLATTEGVHTETTEAHTDTGLLGQFGINGFGFIGQLVNFLLIFLVFKIWILPRVMKMLDIRAARIEQGLKDAEAIAARLSGLEEEEARMRANAKTEARTVLEAAHAQAEVDAQEHVEKAKREVERIIAASKVQLKSEQESMIRDARKEMADIIVAASKKILAGAIDEKKAMSLAEETLRKLT